MSDGITGGVRSDVAFHLPGLTGGGVERMAINISRALAEQGLTVDLVVERAGGELLDAVSSSVSVVILGSSNSLFALPALVRYLRRRRPRAMFSGITNVNLASILARTIARTDTRIVVSERVSLSDNVKTHPLKRLLPPFIRALYPRADQVVAVSAGLADDLAKVGHLPRSDIEVIANPVVTPDLRERMAAEVSHPWLADTDDDNAVPVLVGIGRLVAQKDFATLIRAFALVRRNRNARLIVLGEGPDRGSLELLAEQLGVADDIDLAGFDTNPFPYLKRADVFVLSSIYEGFGNVVVEALAAGCPVVSTDCPFGPSEILDNGAYGKLTPIRDPQAMAAAIIDTLDDPPDPAVLRQRAERYSVETVTPIYTRLLLGAETPALKT